MNRPRLFISAVSKELRTARQLVTAEIRSLGFDAVSQEDFPTGHGELRQWLCDQIASCEGLVQLVGSAYGEEPPQVDPEFGRVSYVQYEFFYADLQGKRTWIITVGDEFPRDRQPDRLDLPIDPVHPDPEGHQAEHRMLQRQYIDTLHSQNHLRHHADSSTELENIILRLRDDLGLLRRAEEGRQRRLMRTVAGVLVGVVVLGVGGWWAYDRIFSEVQEASVVTEARLGAQLRKSRADTYAHDLAEAERAPTLKDRQRLREEAAAADSMRGRDAHTVVALFADIEGEGTSSAMRKMARIVAENGVDNAIEYAASKRVSIREKVEDRASAILEKNRSDYHLMLALAALYRQKGQTEEARGVYQDILAYEPNWLEAQLLFSINEGDIALVRAPLVDAVAAYDHAHSLALRLSSNEPENDKWQRSLALLKSRLGDVARTRGKLEDAALEYSEGLTILEKLVESDPTDTELQSSLSVSHDRLGDVARTQGKLELAASHYSKAQKNTERLAKADPTNNMLQRNLSISHSRLGDVAQAQGKLENAASTYSKARKISEKLAESDPNNTEWQRDLSVSHFQLGDVAQMQGKLDDAAVEYSKGLAISEELADADSSNTEWQHDMSILHIKLGQLAQAQGRLGDAASHYSTARTISKELAETEESNTQWQRDLSVSHNTLGDVLQAQDKLEDAAVEYSKGMAIMLKLVKVDESNTGWQHDLSISHSKLGYVAQARGKLKDAASHYSNALAIGEKLAKADESNARWKRDLSISHNMLGDVAQAQGRLGSALSAYSKGLEISKKVAAEDPTNAEWQCDLSISHYKVSNNLSLQGDWKASLEHAKASRRIHGYLTELDPSNATWLSQSQAVNSLLLHVREHVDTAPEKKR